MNKEIQQIVDIVSSEIRAIIDPEGILFAVSGGPDSVALVDICARHIPQIKERMHIAYIHHGLRKNADKEKLFVKNLARSLAVPFHCKKIMVKRKKNRSLEEQARIKRYKALVEIARKYGCNSIVTGHTLDDQVETVLLNLATGTGLKGLCGMQPVSKIENLLLIRPLLSITKKQILSYLQERKIEYLFDESNIDTRFKRNLIRYQILPLFEKINKGVKKNIYRTSRILTDDFDYIDTQSKKIVQRKIVKKKGLVEFPIKSFLGMHISLQRFFLRNILMELCKLDHPPNFMTIEKIRLSVISHKKIFVDKLKIYLGFKEEKVVLYEKKTFESFPEKPILIKTTGITEIPGTGWKIKTAFRNFSKKFLKNPNPLAAYIDPDKITDKLVVKKPEKDMPFVPLGMGKKISFKKYWKTHKKKISSFIEFPLIVEDSGEIVWVVGGHISQQYAIAKETCVLEITARKK
ncbi:MAG: tRNA lysidine(34) synthetase TilS [Candidatus Omnitrophica bacterium]|nr:tRNA lysidine(34) synthetase TilS [Candidatus Omnitrophota bacterium]